MSQEEEGGEEGEEEDKHSFFPTNNSENMKLEMLEQLNSQTAERENYSVFTGGKIQVS